MADEESTQATPPAAEPAMPPDAQPTDTTTEAVPSKPVEAAQPETQPIDEAQGITAQMAGNEPVAPEPPPSHEATEGQSEPITAAPAPELQRAAASAPTVAATVTHSVRELLAKAQAAIQFRKRKKREKILELFAKKAQHGSTPSTGSGQASSPQVTNDEVEKLLHVSDATAARYLSALVKEGKIKQVGKTGKAVEYTRI